MSTAGVDPRLAASVCRLLGAWAPPRLLVVGDVAAGVVAACRDLPPRCAIERPTPVSGSLLASLDGLGRFAAAVVSDLESAPGDAAATIARVRDVHAPRVCLVVTGHETRSRLGEPALRSLGFAPAQPGQPGAGVYVFDIDRYKATPDWLNPRDWAHPERWDKQRW